MKWLADFTDVADIDIKAYCDRMTDTGSKVEGYETLAEDITGVVVARVLTVEKHPDADKLVVCSVDIGADEPIQIVTGAKNVFPGALIPAATDGAHLPGGIKIKKGKLRGVESCGMMCSIAELGLTLHEAPGAIEDGILILGDIGLGDAVVGTDIRDALMLSDNVVEFEITPNRPDCLSVIGLARETAVSYDRALNLHTPEVKENGDGDKVENYIKVDIASPDLCYRYSAAAVKNVKIAPSPLWMRMRLHAAGVRPINNIVDITNYVMLEYGQPMHAFDYKCLEGSHIIVRNADEGEAYRSLDDKDHTLTSSMLVIADEKKAVALAGIMGGANSEITDDTATVIFESACFNGANVRVSSRRLGMRTESSGRFEKGMDPENTMPALLRALELVQMLGAGEVVDGTIDVYPAKKEARTVQLESEKINAFLGTHLSERYMKETLEKLGFEVNGTTLTVPSFRADVECMNDIAEEVIRIYGYNSIESTGFKADLTQGGRNEKQAYTVRIVDALCGMGMDEINTFSFISPRYYDKIRLPSDSPLRHSLKILNPLGEDTSVMRTTAIASMLETLAYNYNMKNKNVHLFEIATVYNPVEGETLPSEPKTLAISFFDDTLKGAEGFYKMKGVIEALFDISGIEGVEYTAESSSTVYHPGRCARITLGDTQLGIFGEVHPLTAENYGFGCPVYAAELDFDAMFSMRKTEYTFTQLPKFPALERDFSFVCEEELTAGEIEKVIRAAGGSSVVSVKLFDIYRGHQIGEGKKSLSFEVKLRASDRTLTDEEADKVTSKIMKKLAAEFGIALRA